MVKKTVNAPDTDPEQSNYDLPSEKEHLFQVSDVYDNDNDPCGMIGDPNRVVVKCEVVGGDEEGRTLLNGMYIDDTYKGFFATRLFLKAIDLPHKGQIEIDSDLFQGRQFYATVKHVPNKDKTKMYANIAEYNFDKIIKQETPQVTQAKPQNTEEVAWDD